MEHSAARRNPLLHLPDDPSSLRDTLRGRDIEMLVEELVTQPAYFRDEKMWSKIRRAYEVLGSQVDATNTQVLGGLGFALFVRTANREGRQIQNHPNTDKRRIEQLRNRLDPYLKAPAVIDFIMKRYEITKGASLAAWSLHELGTTSYILSCTFDARRCILKLVQPEYQVSDRISRSTANYKHDFGGLPGTPGIYDAGTYWILMDRIDGKTLRDVIREYRDLPEKQVQKKLGFIFGEICTYLETYAENEKTHLDLHPRNILVGFQGDEPRTVTFIDFGLNYVLQEERAGSQRDILEAATYIAPELISEGLPQSVQERVRADIYSLGMMILEAFSRDQFSSDTPRLMADLWHRFPGLAAVVEDLVDRDPRKRHLTYTLSSLSDIYAQIRRRLDHSLRTHDLLDDRLRVILFFNPDGAKLSAIIAPVLSLLGAIRELKDIAKMVHREQLMAYLGNWATATSILWMLIELAFLAAVGLDLSNGLVQGQIGSGMFQYLAYRPGELINNFPGRLVAITFGLAAFLYYMRIFSTVSFLVKGSDEKLFAVTEFWLRWHGPIFCFLPIMYAILYQPMAWPICSSIGLTAIGINNLLTWWVAKRIAASLHHGDITVFSTIDPAQTRQFINIDYKQWWTSIFIYSGSLFLLGLWLLTGRSNDVWVYTIITVAMNVTIIDWNCRKLVPLARGELARLCYARLRLQQVQLQTTAIASTPRGLSSRETSAENAF